MVLPRLPVKHRAGCECDSCRARRRARHQITLAESVTLARMKARGAPVAPLRETRGTRRARKREWVELEVQVTDAKLEIERREIDRIEADWKTRRFAELMARGVPRLQAFEIIDGEESEIDDADTE